MDGTSSLLLMMNDCFEAVHRWFILNGLSLNPDKSEAIVVGTAARQRREGETSTIALGGNSIAVSKAVRTLGVTIDSTLSFDHHVTNICKTSFCHIRALRRIRKLLLATDIRSVATAVVSSRLDYCNSLLNDMTDRNTNRLQRVLNSLARLITNSNSRRHITSVVAEFHWLPVNARIDYKLVLLTYEPLTTERPIYLSKLLIGQSDSYDLAVIVSYAMTALRQFFCSRAFCHSAPTVWNSLPCTITDEFRSVSLSALNVISRLIF